MCIRILKEAKRNEESLVFKFPVSGLKHFNYFLVNYWQNFSNMPTEIFSVYFIPFCLGIGLAASAGFRVFIPLLALSLAAHFGFDLSENWEWVGSWPALITLGIATLFEIGAYFIPWIDNLLDTITVPLATIAGTLLMGITLTGLDSEIVQWVLAIIAGGGTAAVISGSTASGRAASTATTGGIGNFLVSGGETVAASVLSITSFIWAPLALVLALVVIYFLYKFWKRLAKRKNKNLKS